MRGTTADGAEWEVVGELPFTLTGAVTGPPKRGEGPGDTPAKSAPAEPEPPAKPIIKKPLNQEHVPPTPG